MSEKVNEDRRNELRVVGQPTPKKDALLKATGRAVAGIVVSDGTRLRTAQRATPAW